MSRASGMELESAPDGDLVRSGGAAVRGVSTRAGYIPLALEHVVLEGLAAMPVYLRTIAKQAGETAYHFTLFSTPAVRFTERHRERLKEAGVKFIYIPLADQMRFRQQVEAHLQTAVTDPQRTMSAKSELVYETAVELVDELLVDEGLTKKLPRLGSIAKAVTTLVMNDASAFSHLFAASQHDFYTATHMVNVGTWMVPLAYAMGIKGMDDLNMMCIAGMVHDVGKIFVPEEVLNKKGKLSDQDWNQLRSHAELGARHLSEAGVPEMVQRVTWEHHERIDGTGYPRKLRADGMLLASKICAVVDSFDAMTAFRPFKDQTQSFGGALDVLKREAGTKYDADIVKAWVGLMERAEQDGVIDQPLSPREGAGRREHERFVIECNGKMYKVRADGELCPENEAAIITAHSLSRSGLGFLCRQPVAVSDYVKICLLGNGSLDHREVEGQVVWSREQSDGFFQVGLKFASLMAERKMTTGEGEKEAAAA